MCPLHYSLRHRKKSVRLKGEPSHSDAIPHRPSVVSQQRIGSPWFKETYDEKVVTWIGYGTWSGESGLFAYWEH